MTWHEWTALTELNNLCTRTSTIGSQKAQHRQLGIHQDHCGIQIQTQILIQIQIRIQIQTQIQILIQIQIQIYSQRKEYQNRD